jgi:hypothetical protein
MKQNGRRTNLIESASKALANATFAKEGDYYFSYNYNAGRVAEWFKAPVLKTGRGLCSLVSSNLTPSASSSFVDIRPRPLLSSNALKNLMIYYDFICTHSPPFATIP